MLMRWVLDTAIFPKGTNILVFFYCCKIKDPQTVFSDPTTNITLQPQNKNVISALVHFISQYFLRMCSALTPFTSCSDKFSLLMRVYLRMNIVT